MNFDPIRSEKQIHTVIIHGTGVEGRAALNWHLAHSHAQIILLDNPDRLAAVPEVLHTPSRVISYTQEQFCAQSLPPRASSLYLRSPGVPPDNPVFTKIRQGGLPHTTPTGFWLARHKPEHLITITGTKGKSSTASLTAQLLGWAGLPAEAMGNIGKTPFAAKPGPDTICIFELSSYMMHDLPPLPGLHVVTSLYKEHTDWHGSHTAYVQDKLRPLTTNIPPQGATGLVCQQVKPWLQDTNASIRFMEQVVPIHEGMLIIGQGQRPLNATALNNAFAAPSLLLALRASMAICLMLDLVCPAQLYALLQEHLPDWKGLPCRQQIIPSTDGLLWVDDALATVPQATLSALSRWQDRPIHLLLGGKDRGQDFTELANYCAQNANIKLYSFGETNTQVTAALQAINTHTPLFQANTLEELVAKAVHNAKPGDIVLFSPAASSAPPHAHYQQRSAIFQSAIPRTDPKN